MAVLLAVCAVALLVFVSDSSSETAAGTTAKSRPCRNRRKGRGNRYRQRHPDREGQRSASGIETVAVARRAVREASGTLAVPYSAIWYDAKGHAFVYTVTAPLSYIRAPITVDYVEGDQAILSAGPSAGTEIVTLGVAELYGAETGLK